jgi:hypothetical protein
MRQRCLRKDGSAIWSQLTVALVRSEDQEQAYFVRIVEDISERKASEEALRKVPHELEARVAQRTGVLTGTCQPV